MIKQVLATTVVVVVLLFLSSCISSGRGSDALTNQELENLVRPPIEKMLTSARARKRLQSKTPIKIELLAINNKTNYAIHKAEVIINSILEELFSNYENVEFYGMEDRIAGNTSINEQNASGLIKASDQKEAGEQIGADDNIQVTVTSTTATEDEEEFRLIIKWYKRESQRPIAKTSVYITKSI